MKLLSCLALLGLVVFAARCGGRERSDADDMQNRMAGDSAGGMEGMAMPGMQMMPMMRAHMDSMAMRSPEEMQAAMARHQELMSRLLDGMGTDMRSMSMTGDSVWTALSDSVKRDLAELSGLTGTALENRMRAHRERVGRLLDMHERMM